MTIREYKNDQTHQDGQVIYKTDNYRNKVI